MKRRNQAFGSIVRCVLGATFVLGLCGPAWAVDFGSTAGTVFQPLDFSLTNASYSGNAFDVDAMATFTHSDPNHVITVGMYYNGGTEWKFRFTPTYPGTWTFTTASGDSDLNGSSGTVNVAADPNALGFIVGAGTMYARQVGTADNLKGQPYVIFMNERATNESINPGFGQNANIATFWTTARRNDYIAQAKSVGCSAIFIHLNHQVFQAGVTRYDQHSSETPDLNTFAALETIINHAHSEGLAVHFWAWGDESRKWTPIGLPGGANGYVDKRMQRYMADRLGPLPNWTVGYGFDLFEWTDQAKVSEWANYITARSGYSHMLGARGLPLVGPDGTKATAPSNLMESYASHIRAGQILEAAPTGGDNGGPDSYDETLDNVLNDPNHPVLYEERHTYYRYWGTGYLDWPTCDDVGTRRLFWWWTMAGGAGGWIGFYPDYPGAWDGPYAEANLLITHRTFWADRLSVGMAADNSLTSGGAVALAAGDLSEIVFYAEDATSIVMNLGGAGLSWDAIAIDCELDYAEMDLGTVTASNQSWTAPYRSDWAISLVSVQAVPVTLTVISGSGSGAYTDGEVVAITAETAPSGMEFEAWTGDVTGVANVNVPSTTITMPVTDATVTASYSYIPIRGDLSEDGNVDIVDLNMVLIDWSKSSGFADPRSDADGSGTVNIIDLNYVLIDWGKTQ